ncbi:hypothetical protein PUN28_013117 [Cardiocondyla obscurior]|uniref:Uncharacterized protein n=1 Tax=Cardiocondyla obscurior TaxID=286306 RepID=A0AAW2FA41_9HYME
MELSADTTASETAHGTREDRRLLSKRQHLADEHCRIFWQSRNRQLAPFFSNSQMRRTSIGGREALSKMKRCRSKARKRHKLLPSCDSPREDPVIEELGIADSISHYGDVTVTLLCLLGMLRVVRS